MGALIGSTLGKAVDGERLLFFFGLLMLVVGGMMLRPKPTGAVDERPVGLATDLRVAIIALIAGVASGFFGIGGGFLIVPALMLATGMPMIKAVGTSLLAVGTFGLATAINYALSGLVDWTLATEFIGGGVVGGVLGMMLALRLGQSKGVLDRVFRGHYICGCLLCSLPKRRSFRWARGEDLTGLVN